MERNVEYKVKHRAHRGERAKHTRCVCNHPYCPRTGTHAQHFTRAVHVVPHWGCTHIAPHWERAQGPTVVGERNAPLWLAHAMIGACDAPWVVHWERSAFWACTHCILGARSIWRVRCTECVLLGLCSASTLCALLSVFLDSMHAPNFISR